MIVRRTPGVLAEAPPGAGHPAAPFEIHGHRGARGRRPENTLPGVVHALEIGVDVVELDVGISADGCVVVHHDPRTSGLTTRDTYPVRAGDPYFPYVGKDVRELTLAQIKTLDAGTRRPADPYDELAATQLAVPGATVPTLSEVCGLLRTAVAAAPGLALDLKVEPDWTAAEVEEITAATIRVLDGYGMTSRSRILSFDWRVLSATRRLSAEPIRTALVDARSFAAGSAWIAGLDLASFAGDIVAMSAAAGAAEFSIDFRLLTTRILESARALGLAVTAWTVNDVTDMRRMVALGVDAIATDYPDRLRGLAALLGLVPPRPLSPSHSRVLPQQQPDRARENFPQC